MTTPIFPTFLSLLEDTVGPAVTNAQAAVNTASPGAVQSGIDIPALERAVGDLLQLVGDVGQVFAQDFFAVITEVLAAATLATGIIGDIEGAITAAEGAANAGKPLILAAADPAATATASSVLAQVQQQATTNLTLVNTVFQDATKDPLSDNLPSGNELQVLGGQILFQQDINAFLTSLPSSLSSANDTNQGLINFLQNLLLIEQNLNNTLNQIDTYDSLEQPISLTILNIAVALDDAGILLDVGFIFAAYALFALEAMTGNLVTVNTPGAYTVNVPSGAKYVDMVLAGGGAGGGGYNNAGTGSGGNGGNTTATPAGGSTLTAAGGPGGANNTVAATAGMSPGNEAWDGQTYTGGNGGAVGSNGAGGNGTTPGAGGGGGGAYGSYGGAGGTNGSWATETLAVTSGMTTITGTVGAGGTGGVASAGYNAAGGAGAHGEAFFYFYS
jgi:hypothetical protein